MSCPHESEVLLLDSEFTASEHEYLVAHAKTCPSCRPLLQTMQRARTSAQALTPDAPTGHAAAKMWARIEAPNRAGFGFWMPALAGGLMIALGVWTVPPEPTLHTLPAGQSQVVGSARLTASTPIEITTDSDWLRQNRHVELTTGTLSVDIDRSLMKVSYRVSTPHTEITTVDARFQVRIRQLATEIIVEEGHVDIETASGRRQVSASQRLMVPPETIETRLERARTLVSTDLQKAEETATEVVKDAPNSTMAAGALAIVADVHRRRGDLAGAVRWYARVTRHPRGTAYREEAQYQRAQLLHELGFPEEALEVLHTPMPTNTLLPERLMLEAQIRAEQGDKAAAKLRKQAEQAARQAEGP